MEPLKNSIVWQQSWAPLNVLSPLHRFVKHLLVNKFVVQDLWWKLVGEIYHNIIIVEEINKRLDIVLEFYCRHVIVQKICNSRKSIISEIYKRALDFGSLHFLLYSSSWLEMFVPNNSTLVYGGFVIVQFFWTIVFEFFQQKDSN